MSGAPNRPQVQELCNLLSIATELRSQIRQHEAIIRDSQTALGPLRTELDAAAERVQLLLRDMDVESTGNFGHENRVTALAFLLFHEGRRIGAAEAAGAAMT